MPCHCWLVFACLAAAGDGPSPGDPSPAEGRGDSEVSDPDAAAPDPELARLSYNLDALLSGASLDGMTVDEALGGTVPGADTVEERLAAAERAAESLEAALATAGRGELVNGRLRRNIIHRQRQYLERLADAYERMPRPALRALELATQPRAPMRAQVEALRHLQAATASLSERLQTLDDILAAGRLAGFKSEVVPARRHLATVLAALATQHQRGEALVTALEQRAGELERDSWRVRELLLCSLATEDGVQTRDQMHRMHLREARRLRLAVRTSSPQDASIRRHAERATAVAARPERTSDLFAAKTAIAEAQLWAQELVGLLDVLQIATTEWSLAFEREMVTLLEPLASQAARAEARERTTELLEEVQLEAEEGWDRVVSWARDYPQELSQWASSWRSHSGRLVAAFALLVFALFLGGKRIDPMGWLVERLAHWSHLRRHVRLVVRGGTLVQTVFPAAAAYLFLFLAVDLLFERPEVQLFWVFVRWLGLYWIGHQIVLGITRPVAPGRPSLIAASAATSDLLRRTYARLGFFVAIAFIIDEIACGWFGAGHLRLLINLVMLSWIAGWALWAAFAWRLQLAQAWIDLPPSRAELRAARWMRENRLGAFLSAVALLCLTLHWSWRLLYGLADRSGVTAYVRAKSLRRLSRNDTDGSSHPTPGPLPEEYLQAFPLSPLLGEDGPVALSRPETLAQLCGQVDAWRDAHVEGSVALVGEQGTGKSTLLAQLARELDGPTTLHTWGRKATSEDQVACELGPLFDCPGARDIGPLVAAARAGGERIILLDQAHNVFLRTIDGYRGFDALVELINTTHESVFWVLAFNSFAWEFLNQSRGRTHYLRRLVHLRGWTADELKGLIDTRNRQSGYTVEFDPTILDADAEARDFQLVESADGFFRLLWEASGGNPRVGIFLWRQSLQAHFGSIRAKLFRQPSLERVDGLTDEMIFALASICQHGNLSRDDLGAVLRLKPGQARFHIQFLHEAGIIELGSEDNYSLAPGYYQQALQFLRRRHLLFETS